MPAMHDCEIRSTITDDEFGGFRITIPTRQLSGLATYFTSLGIFFWTVVGFLVSLMIVGSRDFSRAPVILPIWLLSWGFFEGLMILVLVESRTGREVVILDEKRVQIRNELAGFAIARRYDRSRARNLRYAALNGQWASVGGAAFDYDGRPRYFGLGLSEYEARRMIATILQRFPFPDDWDKLEPLPVQT